MKASDPKQAGSITRKLRRNGIFAREDLHIDVTGLEFPELMAAILHTIKEAKRERDESQTATAKIALHCADIQAVIDADVTEIRRKEAEAALRHFATAQDCLDRIEDADSRRYADAAIVELMNAVERAFLVEVLGVEREILDRRKAKLRHRAAQKKATDAKAVENEDRDTRLANRARTRMKGTSTVSSVTGDLIGEGMAAGLKSKALREVLRKEGVIPRKGSFTNE